MIISSSKHLHPAGNDLKVQQDMLADNEHILEATALDCLDNEEHGGLSLAELE